MSQHNLILTSGLYLRRECHSHIIPKTHTMEGLPPRIGYIRTISTPEKQEDVTFSFLTEYIRQESPAILLHKPRQKFIFGATTICDTHILNIFLTTQSAQGGGFRHFNNLQTSDLELRISNERANTPSGAKIMRRCEAGGISVVIQGDNDEECNGMMLEQCDYVIDNWTTTGGSYSYPNWFWDTARAGMPQDNMLTNPKYDVSQHDVSKTRLRDRYAGHGWTAGSGGFHGNGGDWRCHCGRKCKRGKCKFEPGDDLPNHSSIELPKRGNQEWYKLSAEDACRCVSARRSYWKNTDQHEFRSIDTFSGE
jgi:hypothetical protein